MRDLVNGATTLETVIPQLGVVLDADAESLTCTENANGPGVVGVPLISPVEVFNVNPGGRDPELRANV